MKKQITPAYVIGVVLCIIFAVICVLPLFVLRRKMNSNM